MGVLCFYLLSLVSSSSPRPRPARVGYWGADSAPVLLRGRLRMRKEHGFEGNSKAGQLGRAPDPSKANLGKIHSHPISAKSPASPTFQSGGNWAPNPRAGNILSLIRERKKITVRLRDRGCTHPPSPFPSPSPELGPLSCAHRESSPPLAKLCSKDHRVQTCLWVAGVT